MPLSLTINCFIFFCVLFLQVASSVGQPVFFDVESAKALYPDESFVLLSRNDRYTVKLVGDSLDIVRLRTEQYLYLKNMSGLGIERSISSSAFVPVISHSACLYAPRGRRFARVVAPAPKKRTNVDRQVFSDDLVEHVYTFNGVTAGTVIELESSHRVMDAKFIPTTFFQSDIPAYTFDCTVEYADGVRMRFLPFNMGSISAETSYDARRKMTRVHYSVRAVPALSREKSQPPLRYILPHVVPVVVSYRLPSGADMPVLDSVQDLYNWYCSLLDAVNPPYVYESLRQFTDSLTAGAETDMSKAEAIYYWVQSAIRYIAVEDGMDGIVPRNADEVFRKRYGDCKDKTSLLHVLLSNAGLRSYICWIGTDELPYRYDELPSPATDNHMIVVLELDSVPYFLDATGSYQNISRPTNFIQGKEALAAVDSLQYRIFRVPELSAERNVVIDSVRFELLPTGELSGAGALYVCGAPKQNLQYSLLGKDAQSQHKTLRSYLQLGNNACLLNSYSIQGNESFDTVITALYSLAVPNYVRKAGTDYYINMNMYRGWESFDIEAGRVTSLYMAYRSSYSNVFTLTVPDGYQVATVPLDESYSHPLFGFETRYTVVGNSVRYEHSVRIDVRMLSPDMFGQWREYMEGLKRSYRQTMVLSEIR